MVPCSRYLYSGGTNFRDSRPMIFGCHAEANVVQAPTLGFTKPRQAQAPTSRLHLAYAGKPPAGSEEFLHAQDACVKGERAVEVTHLDLDVVHAHVFIRPPCDVSKQYSHGSAAPRRPARSKEGNMQHGRSYNGVGGSGLARTSQPDAPSYIPFPKSHEEALPKSMGRPPGRPT